MKIQNKKTKTATTILATLVIGMVLLSPMMVLPNVNAQQEINHDCLVKSEKTAYAEAKVLDQNKAKAFVSNNIEFKTKIQGYDSQFSAISNNWNIGKSDCSLTWQGIDVDYILSDSHGKYVKTLSLTLNPELTKITQVREYKAPKFDIANSISPNWGGYEIAGDSQNSTIIYKAETQFTIPSVQKPTDSEYGTDPCDTGNSGEPPCDLAVWTGLEDTWGASQDQKLVQGGTDSNITCTSSSSCSTQYYMWWELLPTAHICSASVSSGNSVDDTVENDVVNSGTNNSEYDIDVVDTSNGNMCTATQQSYGMTYPTLAPFIDERAGSSCCGVDTLSEFSTNTLGGSTITYSNSTTQSISTPYNDGYYIQDTMTNYDTNKGQDVTNISNGGISGTGDFTETYKTSGGT